MSDLTKAPPLSNGFKFEHILITVTIAHNRGIGQFDDTCVGLITRGMEDYNGVLMCDAQVLYKHSKEDSHVDGCGCGLCEQVRRGMRDSCEEHEESPEPSVTWGRLIAWTKFNGDSIEINRTGSTPYEAEQRAIIAAANLGWTPPRWWQWWRWNDTRVNL